MAAPTLEIRLKRVNKVYREGEIITGFVIIQSKSEIQHQGITLFMDGSVSLNASAKSQGMLDALTSSIKPIQIVHDSVVIEKPGKLPAGRTERPFEIPLKSKTGKSLYETYHGVCVNIQYSLTCEMQRSLLSKNLVKNNEFIVEYKSGDAESATKKPVEFSITPESIQNVKDKGGLGRFKISGDLDSICCSLAKPFTGRVTVEESERAIKSIELQLVRVETCGCAEGYSREKTEIQNIQIAEGDVCRGMAIPVYMVFPRLFACPTLQATNFKVEFEVNVVVIFMDERMVSENFPMKLTRF